MVWPTIVPRVKKAGQNARFWIDTAYVWAFVAVTTRTAKREIIQGSHAAVLFGDDVVDLEP